MPKLTIYLSGPIDHCNEDEIHGWRENVKKALPRCEWRDPNDREYDMTNPTSYIPLVEYDKQDIDESNLVLVYPWKHGVGTPMECMYAWDRNKYILVVSDNEQISPWWRYHSTKIVPNFEEAYKVINYLIEEPDFEEYGYDVDRAELEGDDDL